MHLLRDVNNFEMHDSTPAVCQYFFYEPLRFKYNTAYQKTSFIDKLKNLNKGSNEISKEYLPGLITVAKDRIQFKPENHDLKSQVFYNDDFLLKLQILNNNVKHIVFYTKNHEKVVTRYEQINKNYRAFSLYCYDFRVYNFYRTLKSGNRNADKDVVNFYRQIVSGIFETSGRNSLIENRQSILSSIDMLSSRIGDGIKLMSINNSDHSSDNPLLLLTIQNENDCLSKFFFVNKLYNKIESDYSRSDCQCVVIGNYPDFRTNPDDWNYVSVKEVQESFDKIYTLCTPRDKAQFKQNDKRWLGKLSETRWMSLIERCLGNVRILVGLLSDDIQVQQRRVYLEESVPSWALLYSGLLHLTLEPDSRTVIGFLDMVQSCWMESTLQTGNYGSLFLLFLDCTQQLLARQPLAFQITEETLICIYDLFRSGALATSGCRELDWRIYFSAAVTDTLYNELYDESASLATTVLDTSVLEGWQILEGFWMKMFMRWIPYVQVKLGNFSVRHFGTNWRGILASCGDAGGKTTVYYSNYPFSLNFDEDFLGEDASNCDDCRSNFTAASDD